MEEKNVIILAGGKNSRMNGKNKFFLELNNERFSDKIFMAIEKFDRIIISCDTKEKYKNFEKYILVEDEYKEIGPIGGILSSMKNISSEKALILACDMPYLNNKLLKYLIEYEFSEDALVCINNGKINPLCSVYKKSVIPFLEKMIENNNYKLTNLLDKIDVKYITIEDERNFFNINTVKDYEELLKEY